MNQMVKRHAAYCTSIRALMTRKMPSGKMPLVTVAAMPLPLCNSILAIRDSDSPDPVVWVSDYCDNIHSTRFLIAA